MIRRPPRSTLDRSSAASDVYKRQQQHRPAVRDMLGADRARGIQDPEEGSPNGTRPGRLPPVGGGHSDASASVAVTMARAAATLASKSSSEVSSKLTPCAACVLSLIHISEPTSPY